MWTRRRYRRHGPHHHEVDACNPAAMYVILQQCRSANCNDNRRMPHKLAVAPQAITQVGFNVNPHSCSRNSRNSRNSHCRVLLHPTLQRPTYASADCTQSELTNCNLGVRLRTLPQAELTIKGNIMVLEPAMLLRLTGTCTCTCSCRPHLRSRRPHADHERSREPWKCV